MIKTFHTKLTKKQELAPEVWYFRFDLPEGETISYTAGQYMILFIPQKEGVHPQRRLYSILTAPGNNTYFELIIKIVPGGCASEYLLRAAIGDMIEFQGPAGVFTIGNTKRNKVFFATGTGIAPILSMITDHLPKAPNEETLTLFWGMRTTSDRYLVSEILALTKTYPTFHPYFCLSREESLDMIPENERPYCFLGRIDAAFDVILAAKTDITSFHYYLCGGRDAVETVRTMLSERGIPADQMHFEKF